MNIECELWSVNESWITLVFTFYKQTLRNNSKKIINKLPFKNHQAPTALFRIWKTTRTIPIINRNIMDHAGFLNSNIKGCEVLGTLNKWTIRSV